MTDRACVECGATYTPRMAIQRRCSVCSAKSTGRSSVRGPITCRKCGVQFTPENRTRRFCLACRPGKKRNAAKPCKRCAVEFTPPHYQQQYCETCRVAIYHEKCRTPQERGNRPAFVINLGVTRAGQATWWEASPHDMSEISETRRDVGWPHVWRNGGWHSE